ncbi:MAG TPA: STAS domain-containing protein [Bryobacteraceae bacterium]|nr:STAS domain-containing protein [Bryobacteraceae bacterium]
MKLRAYTRVDSGVAVIELEGEIVLGDGLGLLREVVTDALAQGYTNLLLDLEGVSYIDSAGLGELVSCNALADGRGGDMKLVHLQKKIKGLLQITKLITVFETYENEREAIQSFGRANAAQA